MFFLNAENNCTFNGQRFFYAFLRKAFHLSSQVVVDVANYTNNSNSNYSNPSQTQSFSVTQKSSNQCLSASTGCPIERPFKREAVLSFLRCFAIDCGDSMPEKHEIHLPFHNRKELFVSEFSRLYPDVNPASPQYFRRVWKKSYSPVKVLQTTRFTTCERCDELRQSMKNAVVNGISSSSIKEQRYADL